MVTADKDTWDELIQAHPKKKLATLQANPVSWYSLAHLLFTGTYATGVNAVLPGALPPEQPDNDETSGVPPQSSKCYLPNKKEVKNNAVSSLDDAAMVTTWLPHCSHMYSELEVRRLQGRC
ncbi:hypothetical protein PCANC_15478 [Puccinia coronata f. sp. avenae]|uniref:Uncharacterized protein n=1 Tax=Puccinia coronata f. sp. avenae TaxID=200324 RepID=A0A2N5VFD1_9BASI|nr:hypothetical protein PCANC_15478 [Puccinia coronata f. sp. avenae]